MSAFSNSVGVRIENLPAANHQHDFHRFLLFNYVFGSAFYIIFQSRNEQNLDKTKAGGYYNMNWAEWKNRRD